MEHAAHAGQCAIPQKFSDADLDQTEIRKNYQRHRVLLVLLQKWQINSTCLNKFDLQLFSIFENPNIVQKLNIKISFSYSKQYSL